MTIMVMPRYAENLHKRWSAQRRLRQEKKRCLTYDRETTVGKYLGRKASPFDPMNYEVAAAWKFHDQDAVLFNYRDHPSAPRTRLPLDGILYLVGFNIKFDNLWQWDTPEFRDFFASGGKIWDCQLAHYLLTGQRMNMKAGDMTRPSMNNVSRVLGGQSKIDEVKALWEAGVDTPDIPYDLLMTYLVGSKDMKTEDRFGDTWGDVRTTEYIFRKQVAMAREYGMLAALEARMDSLICSTEMEFNGLHIDMQEAKVRTEQLTYKVEELWDELNCMLPPLPPLEDQWNPDSPYEFSWGSWQQKSALFYGGYIKYDGWEYILDATGKYTYYQKTEKHPLFKGKPVAPDLCTLGDDFLYYYEGTPQDVVKSGKNAGAAKFRNVKFNDIARGPKRKKVADKLWKLPRMVEPKNGWRSSTEGYWSTSADIMEEIMEENTDVPFVEVLSVYAWLEKDLKTYYKKYNKSKDEWKGMLTMVDGYGFIHHQLNHVVTETSRLSSSCPNVQNIPRGDKSLVKKMFSSRYGENGRMAEVDYTAIEVVVKCLLSRDPVMIQDLMDGVDFHCLRLSLKTGEDYEYVKERCSNEDHPEHAKYKAMRQDIKDYSFASQYGAGVKKLATCTGLPAAVIEDLQAKEQARYHVLAAYEAWVETTVNESARNYANVYTASGYPAKRGVYQVPTGTRYVFQEIDAPEFLHRHGIFSSFYKPELMNWPTQGTGGELVQLVMGKLVRHFFELNNYDGQAVLVNTVHDCIWADCHLDVVDQVVHDMKRIMENIPRYLMETFGWVSPVPFPVVAEVGRNMYDMHTYRDYDYDKYPTPHTTAWPESYDQTAVKWYDMATDAPIYE